jgi:hypothetical protein
MLIEWYVVSATPGEALNEMGSMVVMTGYPVVDVVVPVTAKETAAGIVIQ